MSSDKIFSNAVEGAAKAGAEIGIKKIKSWIKSFKEKKLAFIREEKTIETVKEQYRSGEGKFYKKYLKDKEIFLLIRMGLTLRKLENEEKDLKRSKNLRDKIFKKYGIRGLHIVQFVQNTLLNRYVGILIDELESIESLGEKIENILKNIEKHVLFVQGHMRSSDIILKASRIVDAHSPQIFVISGIKSAAETTKECVEKLETLLKNYSLERISKEDMENLFFKRILA